MCKITSCDSLCIKLHILYEITNCEQNNTRGPFAFNIHFSCAGDDGDDVGDGGDDVGGDGGDDVGGDVGDDVGDGGDDDGDDVGGDVGDDVGDDGDNDDSLQPLCSRCAQYTP